MTVTALSSGKVRKQRPERLLKEHCKTPQWRCWLWFGGSQPPRWRMFGGRNNSNHPA